MLQASFWVPLKGHHSTAANSMAPQGEEPSLKTLSNPGTHTAGEDQLYKLFSDIHTCTIAVYVHTHN